MFALLAIVVLGPLLRPGYLFTLDMVFGPSMSFHPPPESIQNFAPAGRLLDGLHAFVPAPVLQKSILLGLLTLVGFCAFRALPLPPNPLARYVAALFFLANPFVYARFLAGQWTVLAAYAVLPLLLSFALRAAQAPSARRAFLLAAGLWAAGVFSLSLLAASLLFLGIGTAIIVGIAAARGQWARAVRVGACAALTLVLLTGASAYWLVPALRGAPPVETAFPLAHARAFAPRAAHGLPLSLTVLSLGGFWAEAHPWGEQFLWPQQTAAFWAGFGALLGLALLGGARMCVSPRTRGLAVLCLVLFLVALLFALGLADSPALSLNTWLFTRFPFWSGFRDSQKFLAFDALSLSVFVGFGTATCVGWLRVRAGRFGARVRAFLLLPPVLGGLFLWGGAHGQLRALRYPESWERASRILAADVSGARVLFLPWHGYLSFPFTGDLLVANPARAFFGSSVVASRSLELGDVYDQEADQVYQEIDRAVQQAGPANVRDTLALFRRHDIGYIAFAPGLERVDPLSYPFLSDRGLVRVVDDQDLILSALPRSPDSRGEPLTVP